jgi:CheY-like chemotaxis protein
MDRRASGSVFFSVRVGFMDSARILLVEDEALVGIEIKNTLQRLGYTRTDLVKSGEGVLEEVQEHPPDLILMDVNLDGTLDGIEATQKIHREYDVPVIFVTAYSSDSILERMRETEAIGYLIKPIDDSDLETITRSVLGDGEGNLNSGQLFLEWLKDVLGSVTSLTPTVPRIPV